MLEKRDKMPGLKSISSLSFNTFKFNNTGGQKLDSFYHMKLNEQCKPFKTHLIVAQIWL